MEKNYTLIGLVSFLIAFAVSFPLGGLIWLIFNNENRFGVALGPITIYSFESLVIISFIIIFGSCGLYFYFKSLPALPFLTKKNETEQTNN